MKHSGTFVFTCALLLAACNEGTVEQINTGPTNPRLPRQAALAEAPVDMWR